MNRRSFLSTCMLSTMAFVFTTSAEASETLLTIQSGDGRIEMTDEALLELPQVSFSTTSIWTEGVNTYSGPSLKTVLAQAGINGGTIELTAVNDYTVVVDYNTLDDDAPIIANRINDQAFSRREKGPLWVVYPYDSDDSYKTEQIYSNSIWQLVHIAAK